MWNKNPMIKISEKQAEERLYEISINCQNEPMQIIKYNDATDIDILFIDTGNIIYHQTYNNFKKGSLKDYFLPTFFECGILGNSSTVKEGERTVSSLHWEYMLKRCYNKQALEKHPTYKNCSVCEEWLYLSNFEKWFDKNYYVCGDEKMCLDKDVLIKNNHIYSPDTATFVPERINALFTKTNKTRGDYPIGVCYKKKNKKFVAQVSKLNENGKQQEHLGLFDTPEQAFVAYKTAKELYIKEIADNYMNKYDNFPRKIYDALYNYQVEITD